MMVLMIIKMSQLQYDRQFIRLDAKVEEKKMELDYFEYFNKAQLMYESMICHQRCVIEEVLPEKIITIPISKSNYINLHFFHLIMVRFFIK